MEILQARELNKVEAERILNKFLNFSYGELQAFSKEDKNNVHEMLVASILLKAISTGDNARLEWIYQRLIGKVKEQLEVTNSIHDKIMEFAKERQRLLESLEMKEAKKDEPV